MRPAAAFALTLACTVPVFAQETISAAMTDALGAAYDAQFPSGDAEARATFIACAGEAFLPFSEEDQALLIATKFNPGAAVMARMEEDQPGLTARVTGCAEAATKANAG